jgi:hypothetical protein
MDKSLHWYLRRHPLLYQIRYSLVSKKVGVSRIENFCYNTINKKKDIPSLYFELNQSIFGKKNKNRTDLKKAKKIAKWLINNIKGGPGLGKSSQNVLIKMLKGEGGVCSDLAQVFNNFCVINDIKVKEWGLKIETKDSNLKGGHSFNEIFSSELGKWIIIDVSKSILFYQTSSKLPLSVIELIDLKTEKQEVNLTNFNKKKQLDENHVRDLYFNPNSFPFLITHYCNKTYDTFLDTFEFLPESIIHGLVYLTGQSYLYEFPITTTNKTLS